MNVLDALSLQEVSKPSTSAHPLVLIGALETLTPPATPPLAMTPVLEPLIPSNRLNEFCQQSLGILEREDIVAEGSTTQVQREHSGKNIQDAGKLEHLLAEAREIIEKRERGE